MTDPRYGTPPGFTGAYEEPTKGEFQPGDETDPNAGRRWSKAVNMILAAHASASGSLMARHSGAVLASMLSHGSAVSPEMNPYV